MIPTATSSPSSGTSFDASRWKASSSPPACACGPISSGFFEDQSRTFWQFEGSDQRLAGVGILTGVTAEGYPCPLPPEIDLAFFEDHVQWLDDVSVSKVNVLIVPTETEHGLWPRVVTMITWSDQQLH